MPIAHDDAFATVVNKSVSGSLAANDVLSSDGGNVFSAVTLPQHGSLGINPDGTFTYTPGAGFVGQDSFTYRITDANGDVSIATVILTILGMHGFMAAILFYFAVALSLHFPGLTLFCVSHIPNPPRWWSPAILSRFCFLYPNRLSAARP